MVLGALQWAPESWVITEAALTPADGLPPPTLGEKASFVYQYPQHLDPRQLCAWSSGILCMHGCAPSPLGSSRDPSACWLVGMKPGHVPPRQCACSGLAAEAPQESLENRAGVPARVRAPHGCPDPFPVGSLEAVSDVWLFASRPSPRKELLGAHTAHGKFLGMWNSKVLSQNVFIWEVTH